MHAKERVFELARVKEMSGEGYHENGWDGWMKTVGELWLEEWWLWS
jgi:hypothetical protein